MARAFCMMVAALGLIVFTVPSLPAYQVVHDWSFSPCRLQLADWDTRLLDPTGSSTTTFVATLVDFNIQGTFWVETFTPVSPQGENHYSGILNYISSCFGIDEAAACIQRELANLPPNPASCLPPAGFSADPVVNEEKTANAFTALGADPANVPISYSFLMPG